MKVLIVDDEEIIVQGVLKHISRLTDMDITAVGAYSGPEALTTMELFRPDLLITDIQMPGMNGLDLIQQVQARNLCPRCIVLTAYEEFAYARRALEMGVMGYMVKPIDWDELDTRLRQLSQGARSRLQTDEILRRYESLYAHTLLKHLSPTLKKITRHVQKNYAQELSLLQLSCQTGLTESYICTLFKKEMGITFLDYVNELRLYQAMRALVESPRLPVRDVAAMVGYGSERQLFRLFNARLGMTPQQFREQNAE
ncbi:MAG: response regulator [Aristaeellaceae bacterium]